MLFSDLKQNCVSNISVYLINIQNCFDSGKFSVQKICVVDERTYIITSLFGVHCRIQNIFFNTYTESI